MNQHILPLIIFSTFSKYFSSSSSSVGTSIIWTLSISLSLSRSLFFLQGLLKKRSVWNLWSLKVIHDLNDWTKYLPTPGFLEWNFGQTDPRLLKNIERWIIWIVFFFFFHRLNWVGAVSFGIVSVEGICSELAINAVAAFLGWFAVHDRHFCTFLDDSFTVSLSRSLVT